MPADITMTEKNESDQSRRSFIKRSAAVGAAATTGVAAFGGEAAAQQNAVANVDANQLNVVRQRTGNTRVAGLINVVLQNVNVQALNNVIVNVGGINVNVQNIQLLSNNRIKIVVQDVIDITQNQVQVAVTVLGTTLQGQQFEATGGDTVNVVGQ